MYQALVVDDEPHVRDLLGRALGRRSVQCDLAADGDQALEACDRKQYDAVVTDLRMPRRHGHSLVVELLTRDPRPRIVVLSGLAEPRLVGDLAGRGVDRVVQKPIDFNELARDVVGLIAGRAAPAAEPAPLTELQQLAQIERSLVELTELFADRLEGAFELSEELSDPPAAVANFITRQAEIEAVAGAEPAGLRSFREQRETSRIRCDTAAIAVPVDSQFARSGEPFKLAIRDVSEGGIRLLHTRATNARFLALCWSAQSLPMTQLRVVARVTRCRPLSPFYDIGGQFVLAD